MRRKAGERWVQSELDEIRRLWLTHDDAEIAALLGRPMSMVTTRRSEMGLRRPKGRQSQWKGKRH